MAGITRTAELGEGDASRLLRMLGRRYAVVVHGLLSLACGLIGLFVARPSPRTTSVVLIILIFSWAAFYSWRLFIRSSRLLVLIDVLVVATVCVNVGVTEDRAVLAVGAGWVISWATFVCVSYQLHTSPVLGLGATVVIDVALGVGIWRVAAHEWRSWIFGSVWLIVSAGLGRWLWIVVSRGGRLADSVADAASDARLRREFTRAARADEQRTARMLHDTASTTLMMVGVGCIGPADDWLPDQAKRDLDALSRVPEDARTRGDGDLRRAIGDIAGNTVLLVDVDGPDRVQVPIHVAAAFAAAVREALTNTLRHARTRSAACTIRTDPDSVVVEVTDNGRGFVTTDVRKDRRGIEHSIIGVMASIDGRASVASHPGFGTRVELSWHRGHDNLPDDDEAVLWQADLATATGQNLLRHLRAATLAVAAAVTLVLTPATFVGNRGDYHWLAGQFIAYGLVVLVFVVGIVLFIRERQWGLWTWPAIGVLGVAGFLSSIDISSTAHSLAAYWFTGTVPWLVLVVLGERLRAIVILLVAHHVFGIGRVIVLAEDSATAYLPGMITSACYGLAMATAVWTLAGIARGAAQDRRAADEIRIADQMAARTHRNRQRRYAQVSATAAPLLTGLSRRTLDPQDETVQRRCAIESARMRRIFAELDEVSDPLLHTLRACAAIAERREVVVTLDTAGSWPEPPLTVRRMLTELPLVVLATAKSQARITVIGDGTSVSISVVADCPDLDVVPVRNDNVHVELVHGDAVLWLEASWRQGSSR